jgi:hypothetical protein
MNHQESNPAGTQSPLPDENRCAVILKQLTRIEKSHAFGSSARAKQFLSYVVGNAVKGHNELLKERSIGVNLFDREPTYITGEDPIVRVKAAEVRKRLAQYYAEEERAPEVRIEIPVGSYIPKFHWGPTANATPPPSETPVIQQGASRPKLRPWKFTVLATVLAFLGIAAAYTMHQRASQKSSLEEFWAPAFTTGQPVLICLPTPVAYNFTSNVYMKAEQAHARPNDSETDRDNTPLQLDPDTPLKWKDTVPVADFFVNKDDAYVAADLSNLFGRIRKSSQVRIGQDFTYEDLRNSPAVLIGVFDNPWTIRMMSDLPIVFREQGGSGWIQEQGNSGRIWRPEGHNQTSKDLAIVARLLNSKTGQFLVIVGGLGMVGTEAAGRFVSRQGDLDAALRTAPAGWERKNLELVLETDVINGSSLSPGSPATPRVLAVKTW